MAFSKIVKDEKIRENFPDAQIGWLLADVTVQESHPYSQALKQGLLPMLAAKDITLDNLTDQYEIAQWREVFRSMGVKPQKYRSTAHIDGDIVLRYGRSGEKFLPLGSDEEVIPVEPQHIVYADDSKIISWLWCYRDTRLTGVTLDTKEAVFIVDTAFTPKMSSVQNGLDMLSEHLIQMGCKPKDSGIVY